MKDIQSQIQRYLAAYGALMLVAIALMTLPSVENLRATTATKIGLTPDSMWLPVSSILALALFATYLRLKAVIASPLNDLARHIREGESSGYNFQLRSRSKEETVLKGYIENHELKISKIKEERDAIDNEFMNTRDERDIAISINKRQTNEIADLDRIQKELRIESQTLAASNEVLEAALDTERKTKIGREVKMRAEEIYAQVERAVSEASARSIWIPNLINQIETPTALINELSSRLESNWREISLIRLGEEISEIRRQSDLQCSLLESVDPEGLLPIETEYEDIEPTSKTGAPASLPKKTLVVEPNVLVIEEDSSYLETSNKLEDFIESEAIETSAPEALAENSQPNGKSTFILEPTPPEKPITRDSPIEKEEFPAAETFDPEATTGLRLPENAAYELVDPITVESIEKPDPESLSALQALVFELVNDYSKEVEKISVDADFADNLDIEVDEELLESVLSNLLEIAIYQWKEGSVKLRVSRQDNQITFAVNSKGKPLAYGEMDEGQTNRIASALDRKIDVDMPSDGELRMRYRYIPEEA